MAIELVDGLVEVPVTRREVVVASVKINPSDAGFMETLYGLAETLDSIEQKCMDACKDEEDYKKVFALKRSADKEMREVVDSVFGDGFCTAAFNGLRMDGVLNDGTLVYENLMFKVVDAMDEDIRNRVAKRNATVEKYTSKYIRKKA